MDNLYTILHREETRSSSKLEANKFSQDSKQSISGASPSKEVNEWRQFAEAADRFLFYAFLLCHAMMLIMLSLGMSGLNLKLWGYSDAHSIWECPSSDAFNTYY